MRSESSRAAAQLVDRAGPARAAPCRPAQARKRISEDRVELAEASIASAGVQISKGKGDLAHAPCCSTNCSDRRPSTSSSANGPASAPTSHGSASGAVGGLPFASSPLRAGLEECLPLSAGLEPVCGGGGAFLPLSAGLEQVEGSRQANAQATSSTEPVSSTRAQDAWPAERRGHIILVEDDPQPLDSELANAPNARANPEASEAKGVALALVQAGRKLDPGSIIDVVIAAAGVDGVELTSREMAKVLSSDHFEGSYKVITESGQIRTLRIEGGQPTL